MPRNSITVIDNLQSIIAPLAAVSLTLTHDASTQVRHEDLLRPPRAFTPCSTDATRRQGVEESIVRVKAVRVKAVRVRELQVRATLIPAFSHSRSVGLPHRVLRHPVDKTFGMTVFKWGPPS